MNIIVNSIIFIFWTNLLEFLLNIFLFENYFEFRKLIQVLNRESFHFKFLKDTFISALSEEIYFRIPIVLLSYWTDGTIIYIFIFLINLLFALCHYNSLTYIQNIIVNENLQLKLKSQTIILFFSIFSCGLILSTIALKEGFIFESTMIHFIYNVFSVVVF